MVNPQQMIRLKHQLYSKLLEKPHNTWTDSEIDIAYALSKDKDIQITLEIARKVVEERDNHEAR